MKKEKDNCELCSDELYGGAPCALEQAEKEIENRRLYIKKVMKPAEEKVDQLKKDTATTEVRLQGTKETKAPSLKPYTEEIHVKDRKELSELINKAKEAKNPWTIRKSMKEGYRYIFITRCLNEAKEEKPEPEEELDLDIASDEEVAQMRREQQSEEEPVELEEPIKELTACDVFANHLDIHGNEDHSVTMCLKGELDKEDACCLNITDLTDEEYEILKDAFHEEEEGEVLPEPEQKEEVIEEAASSYGEFIDNVNTQCKETGETPIENIKRRFSTLLKNGPDKLLENEVLLKLLYWCCNVLINGKAEDLSEALLEMNGDRKIREKMKKIQSLVEEWLGYPSLDAYSDRTLEEIVKLAEEVKSMHESRFEKVDEASTAMKKAFDNGGKDYDDLLLGKSIARIKDPKARKAAVDLVKNGDTEIAKERIIGPRKEAQADASIQKKMAQMQNAKNESLTLTEEDATVSDDLEVRLDDLQYFKPCAGARDTWKVIIDNDKLEELAKALGDFAKDGKMTTTDLNDLLWFEKDWVFDVLDINPFIKHGDDVIDAEVEGE